MANSGIGPPRRRRLIGPHHLAIEGEGSFVRLAAHHEGKKLYSANDVVRSYGLIYFHS
jgi:hypothetical protein